MTDWHFATAYEIIADSIGDKPALICGDITRSWDEYDDRAARIATVLTEHGLKPESKAGIYLHNSNEYLEVHHGVMKLRGCPINVNYRYREDELVYLLNNADAEAVIYQACYADRIESIRERLDKVKCFIQVDDDSGNTLLNGALDYEQAIAASVPMARINRSAEDLYMLYTGGTTGLPKGVMFANGELCIAMSSLGEMTGAPVPETVDQLSGCIAQSTAQNILPIGLVCCPLMHGTGMWLGAMLPNLAGGATLTINHLGLDPDQLWQEAIRHKASIATIVGDAFARPMLSALDAAVDRGEPYDISNVKLMISSGVMWSKEIKEGLLRHNDMTLFDAIGSTEGSMGSSVTTRDAVTPTAKFELGENVSVFDDNDHEVQPGSGEMGMVGTQSPMRGYYKDPEKTAKTVREIDGGRWVFPGDYATIDADGTLNLLGRGSMCINTAGEKVFPEEVEEALKSHSEVEDCLVVGVPDERFGEKVAAVVSLRGESTETELIDFCREHIAGYKLPKHVLLVTHVQRAPNGKADYKWAKQTALDLLG
ncbi:MAG: acyl-CoA synthetase [Gammaproteobacteria bacterium]|nr:acyl-CoA synthetase [Gammaproteobacteria bacterium]MBT4492238.1 acyl-CoA synthetase [Gammaproteobacteria bacterium]MBT7369719.1 acyl-CoA synthetase [Gammaproteobacteria bacterium]